MKNSISIFSSLLLLTFFFQGYGQIDESYKGSCYKIKFIKKGIDVPDSLILPVYQKHGFEIVENAVYDLIVDGKKKFQSLIFNIDSNIISISQNWYFIDGESMIPDTTLIHKDQKLKIRLLWIDQGVGGIPSKVGSKDYNINYVKDNKYCKMEYAKVDDSDLPNAFYYFTGYPLKKIVMKNGKPFFVDKTTYMKVRRK